MNPNADSHEDSNTTSFLKYSRDQYVTVKLWKDRLQRYNQLKSAQQDSKAVLVIFPETIHGEILRLAIYSGIYYCDDPNDQPDLFPVTFEMRKQVISKLFEDFLLVSMYFEYLYNQTIYSPRLLVSYFRDTYSSVMEKMSELFPDYSFYSFELLSRFSSFTDNLIVYPENIEDLEKIRGLIRLHHLDQAYTDINLDLLPVKYLDNGVSFQISRYDDFGLDFSEVMDLLEPFNFSLIQSTITPDISWTDTYFERLHTGKLELFYSHRYRDGHERYSYDKIHKKFKRYNTLTKEEQLIDLTVKIQISHPSVKIYTSHPDILTVEADYDVPVNEYDISTFSIDHEEYRLPDVPEELEDENLTELIEKCKEERLYKFM